MKPSVHHSICTRLGILPISGHHIFAAYDDFSLLTYRNFIPLLIAYLAVHRLDDTPGRAENRMPGRIGADDGRSFGESVSLEHRHADGAEETLEFNVEEGSASHKEFHASAEVLAHSLEYQFVEDPHQRPAPAHCQASAIVIFFIIGDCVLYCKIEKLLNSRALRFDCSLYVLLEIARQSRHRQHHVRTGFPDGGRYIPERGKCVLSDRHESNASSVRHHSVHSGYMRETMVKRQDDEHHIVLFDIDDRCSLLNIRSVIAVRKQDALGICGGA